MAKKQGKYDHVTGNLPPLPLENVGFQEKVNAFKDEVRAVQVHTSESLAKAYKELRRGTVGADALRDPEFTNSMIDLLGDDGIDALMKACNIRVAAYEQMLAESHDHDEPGWGMYGASDNTLRLSDGGSVSVSREPTGKVKDKNVFRLWCITNGLEETLQLWPSTANSIVKQRCLDGKPAPDGIEVFSLTKVILRKGDED